MSENLIDVRGLCKQFNGHPVVDKVDLQVKKGEVFGFLGPNGSGKTTTIQMLCGLLRPDAGEGTCLGYDILTQSEAIKKHVGYMIQHFSLYTDLSIQENLDFIARVYNVPHRSDKVAHSLERLGLSTRKNQLTGELSGGWKQRVALAACLIHDPELLLLDEPTAGVDPMARREFWDQIHALSDEGVTTLVSTHYMDEAERCTRIAYLAYGHLLTTGTVSQVIKDTHLKTWEIRGEATTTLLQQVKKLKGVVLAALLGNVIHVGGYEEKKIERQLQQLATQYAISWQQSVPTLEDAFISLVTQSQEEASFGTF